jgi:hypothetical protein
MLGRGLDKHPRPVGPRDYKVVKRVVRLPIMRAQLHEPDWPAGLCEARQRRESGIVLESWYVPKQRPRDARQQSIQQWPAVQEGPSRKDKPHDDRPGVVVDHQESVPHRSMLTRVRRAPHAG